MFRTTKCPSSGRFAHAFLWYLFMHPYKQSGRCQDPEKYHKTASTSLPEDEHLVFETCRRKYIYSPVLKRLSTPSDFHIPLSSILPFPHSQVSFIHGCIYPIFLVLLGRPRFFLPSGFRLAMIFVNRFGSILST